MNGHCLVWDSPRHSVPSWLYDMPNKKAVTERRIREIAERYGQRIERWDIVNEPIGHFMKGGSLDYPFPAGYEAWAFECAGRYLPKSAFQMINENIRNSWPIERAAYYHKLIRELCDGGAKIDGIGLQWHLFTHETQEKVLAGEHLDPEHMQEVLYSFIDYGVPLHISEITIHSFSNDAQGQHLQAELARDTYRFWFSHRAVHAITWWNVLDGGAVIGEDKLFSGLLNKDLSPKPAFDALDQLINHDWRTETTDKTDANGVARFRGFHGRYDLCIDGKRLPFELHAKASDQITLTLTVQE